MDKQRTNLNQNVDDDRSVGIDFETNFFSTSGSNVDGFSM